MNEHSSMIKVYGQLGACFWVVSMAVAILLANSDA